jgi:hypothetical protein
MNHAIHLLVSTLILETSGWKRERERESTDEEDDVGVVELGEEGHLGAELEHAPLVELLLDEPLDGHLDALPLALEHHPV